MYKAIRTIFLVLITCCFLEADYVPGVVLVRLKQGIVELPQGQTHGGVESIVGNEMLRNYMASEGLTKVSKVFRRFSSGDTLTQLDNGMTVKVQDLSLVFKLLFGSDANIESIVDSLEQSSAVLYAEPDYIGHPLFIPNDDSFPKQWALRDSIADHDIDADSAWEIEKGNSNIKIGILDSGVRYWHLDLGNACGPGHKVSGGWDYWDDDNDPNPPYGDDHGTQVAGVAGALTHNDLGISGVAGGSGGPDIGCELYAYRIPEYQSDLAEAIVDAAGYYNNRVLNSSWGWNYYGEVLREAVCYAYKCSRTFCASKGNGGEVGNPPNYPSDFDHHWVISVGATNSDDQKASWSSYGRGIDCVAPGVNILTTDNVGFEGEEEYEWVNGTSFSAPHVAGLAGLIRSIAWENGYHEMEPEDIQGVIRSTADDLYSPGYDDLTGDGRINAYDALRYYEHPRSIRHFTVATTGQYTIGYLIPMQLIGIDGLPDGDYFVDIYAVYSDFILPVDTVEFLGVWGLGRLTTGYSVAEPNYGEGYCSVEELSGDQYRAETHVYFVREYPSGDPIDWFPCSPGEAELCYSVFSVNVVPPYSVHSENKTETSLTIRWDYDYPESIDGYTVKRDGLEIGNPPPDQKYWNDSGLDPGHMYHYEVLARKGSIYSSAASSDESTYPSGMLAESDYPKMSAFNTGTRTVKHGDTIYVAYAEGDFANREIIILRSLDCGLTFEEVHHIQHGWETHPAIAITEDGTPYVVWGRMEWSCVPMPPYSWHRRYYCTFLQGGSWTEPILIYDYDTGNTNNPPYPPETTIAPPSLTLSSDSAYVAFQDKDTLNPLVHVTRFLLSDPNYNADETIPNTWNGQDYVPIGYDVGSGPDLGRVVVPWRDQAGDLYFYYRELGADWDFIYVTSEVGVIPDGSPSLYVSTDEVRCAFEGYYLSFGVIAVEFEWVETTPVENEYVIQNVEVVTADCDSDPLRMEGYTFLPSYDIVTWRYDDDVWYSRKSGGEWLSGENVSDMFEGVSSYPQGVAFLSDDYRLFALWTENIGNDAYLVRDTMTIVSLPIPPDVRVSKQSDDAVITWNAVTSDILGNPLHCGNYTTYRATTFDFVPGPANLIATGSDTTVTDTDALLGSDNYNYLSFSESEYDMKSTKSNMGYVFHKFVNENPKKTDRNWVSLPWYNNYSTVSDLTDDLSPSGDPLTIITRLDDTLQLYESYVWNDVFSLWLGPNFAIEPGRGYEMITTVDTSLMLVGSNDPDGLINLNWNSGKTSRNWVAIPYNAVYTTVSEITNEYSREGEAISVITNIRDDQLYESWLYFSEIVGWLGNNFAIEPGRGYEMVAVTDTTWNPTEYSNEAKGMYLAGGSPTNVQASPVLGTSTMSDRSPAWVFNETPNEQTLEVAAVKGSDYQCADSYRLSAQDSRTVAEQIESSHSAMESENTYGDEGGPGASPDNRRISHTVRSYLTNARGFENFAFTTYRVDLPEDVLTERIVGSATYTNQQIGVIWFDVGNFRIPWKHGQEAVLIIEATKNEQPYYDVINYVLDEKVDIQRLKDIELKPMPDPGSSSFSSAVLSRNIRENNNIIGYSLYRDGKRLNSKVLSKVLQEVQSVADNTNLRLVIRGGHETVYSSDGIQSRPDKETAISFAFDITPNPFVKHARIDYALPTRTSVRMVVYDAAGRHIKTLVSESQQAGYYSQIWDGFDDHGSAVPAGIYFVRMKADGYDTQEKILLVK